MFSIYRCPYLNVNTVIETGASLYGSMKIDYGGFNPNAYFGELGLIGPDSAFMFQVSDKEEGRKGHVKRTSYFDSELKNVNDEE